MKKIKYKKKSKGKNSFLKKLFIQIRCIFNKKFRREMQIETDRKNQFLQEWTNMLNENADVFSGLYNGLQRIIDGTAKKKNRIVHEWWIRAHYQWEGKPFEQMCKSYFEPLTENGDDEDYIELTELLLEAARSAGIIHDEIGSITLDESNTNAYLDWDGEDLYLGDTVEIMTPAWYQNGRILEQGYCKKISGVKI